MSWTITGIQQYPAVIGEPFGGGYFAGYISHTADGNPTHALIVAPRETGISGSLQAKTSNTTSTGSKSTFDGKANTDWVVANGLIDDHPAYKFCVDLNLGGFTDWYLPAWYELEIAYFHFKPAGSFTNSLVAGSNPYAVPVRSSNYIVGYPPITSVPLFDNNSLEGFGTAEYWTSYEQATFANLAIGFNTGGIAGRNKDTTRPSRAFRRIAL
jgi:hypothetical protein